MKKDTTELLTLKDINYFWDYSSVALITKSVGTWQEAFDYVKQEGGRLPTLVEAREKVQLEKWSQISGELWVPIGDETNKDWMQIGKTDNKFLSYPNMHIPQQNTKSLYNMNPDQCKTACLNENTFTCKSIDYANTGNQRCHLSDKNKDDIALGSNTGTFTYYEVVNDIKAGYSHKIDGGAYPTWGDDSALHPEFKT